MKKITLFIAFIAMFFISTKAQTNYSLVTNLSQISTGQKVVLVGTDASGAYYAIGNQKGYSGTLTNRYSIAVTDNSGIISLTPCSSTSDVANACEFAFSGSSGAWLFYDVLNEGFLSPRVDDNSANGLIYSTSAVTWSINMNSTTGLSAIVANTSATSRIQMRHNYQSSLFASYLQSYETAVSDIYIYASSETATTPMIVVTSPADGAIIQEDNVTVNFSIQNFIIGTDGNLIYTLNEEAPIIISNPSTTSINLTNLADGDYTLVLTLDDGAKSTVHSVTLTFSIFTETANETEYTLITNVNDIQYGKKCIIVGKTADGVYYAMGNQNSNSRASINVTSNLSNNVIAVTPAVIATETTVPYEITFEGTNNAWVLHDEVNQTKPYLAPRTEDSNGMPGSTSPVTWNITIDATGLATIVANDQATYPRPDMRFNENTAYPPSVFSCYYTSQSSPEITHVYIYMSNEAPGTEPNLTIISPTNNSILHSSTVNVNYSVANFTIGTDGKIKYTVDSDAPLFITAQMPPLTLAEGNHTITMELVDMNEVSLATPVIKTVNFTIDLTEPTVTSIYDIQYTTSASGDSPLKDETVWVEGIVTFIQYKEGGANDGQIEGYYIQDDITPWSGIYVFDVANTVQPGNTVKLQAKVSEYYSFTELTNISNFEITNIETVVPAPIQVTGQEAMTEAYESCFVSVACFTVSSSGAYGNFTVTDNASNFTINKTHQMHLADQYLNIGTSYTGYGVVNYRDMMRIMLAHAEETTPCLPNDINSNIFNNTNFYPNPVNEEIYINTDKTIENIQIINLMGQIIIEQNSIENAHVINLKSLNSGLYIIKYSDGNAFKIEKFIKK